jgi:hypothetical protein
MIWTLITNQEAGQPDNGRVTSLLVGTAGQVTDPRVRRPGTRPGPRAGPG